MEEVVAVGEWLYDGRVPMPVRVVRLDYDFWFAIGDADGDLQTDEGPRLNSHGHAFYVRYKPGWVEGEPFWPDSIGYMTLDEAQREAESKGPRRGALVVVKGLWAANRLPAVAGVSLTIVDASAACVAWRLWLHSSCAHEQWSRVTREEQRPSICPAPLPW